MSERVHNFFEQLSYRWLVALAVVTALAPWPAGPQPHLYEKLVMLSQGQLSRPLDIFDLFFHGSALVLLVIKAGYDLAGRRTAE